MAIDDHLCGSVDFKWSIMARLDDDDDHSDHHQRPKSTQSQSQPFAPSKHHHHHPTVHHHHHKLYFNHPVSWFTSTKPLIVSYLLLLNIVTAVDNLPLHSSKCCGNSFLPLSVSLVYNFILAQNLHPYVVISTRKFNIKLKIHHYLAWSLNYVSERRYILFSMNILIRSFNRIYEYCRLYSRGLVFYILIEFGITIKKCKALGSVRFGLEYICTIFGYIFRRSGNSFRLLMPFK